LKKEFLIGIVIISLGVYFAMTTYVLPEKFLAKEQFTPSPKIEVQISNSQIKLGESFRISTISENVGDYGDIHIVSVAFPNLSEIDDIVRIVSYDYSNSPIYVKKGDKIGAEYSGGEKSVSAKYPSIEAMNRPAKPGIKYVMDLQITPKISGPFLIYVKSIDIPHTSSISHFPQEGNLDHQGEHVLVYTINVNP